MPDQPEFEELEHIPWSALAAKSPDPRLRLALIAVAAIATLGIGLLAVRGLLAGDTATTATVPPVATTPVVDGGAVADTTDSDPIAVIPIATEDPSLESPVPEASIYSEADLMAIAVDDESRLAVMRAEWFVQDYFTVDGDIEVAAALAAAVDDVSLPHDDPSGASYVEWARAYAVSSPTPGRYVVAVAYRTLSSTGSVDFVRAPVRAVAMTVAVDVDGTTTIVDLPSPVQLPGTGAAPEPSGDPAAASEAMIAEALRAAAAVGDDPAVVDVTRIDSSWRFVIEVADASGNRWPIVVPIENT